MRLSWLSALLGVVIAVAFPLKSSGQDTEVSIGASGLVSFQPIDDTYVGAPYLSEGIGGVGPGLGAAFNVVTRQGLVVAAEFTTAWFEREQSGRLVPGTAATTELNDSLLGALVGYAGRNATNQVQIVGGVYWPLDRPTVNGQPLDESVVSDSQPDLPFAFGGGLDVVHAVGANAALVIGARYIHVPRDENSQFLGIGPHVVRAGVGLRFRLN